MGEEVSFAVLRLVDIGIGCLLSPAVPPGIVILNFRFI
jgi:hypothetical protein